MPTPAQFTAIRSGAPGAAGVDGRPDVVGVGDVAGDGGDPGRRVAGALPAGRQVDPRHRHPGPASAAAVAAPARRRLR